MRAATALFAIAGMAVAANAQVTFNEIAKFGIGNEFNSTTANGTNGAAIAWDGTNVYVAGYNNSGAPGSSGIVHYNASGAVQNSFGSLSTPNGRGYSGIDVSASGIAAAYDDGAADANGLQLFNSSGAQQWAFNIRGGSGTAFDPGFGGADSGVASITFGSGRRWLNDTGTGATIYDGTNGMIVTDFGGSFWRSMDFRDSDGDMVLRRANDLIYVDRTGGNSGNVSVIVDTNENAPFVNGQNVAFAFDTGTTSDFIIYNDRAAAGSGQLFETVVGLVDTSGASIAANFNYSDAGFGAGNAYYDFSYDAGTGTLAVVDFFNNEVRIFSIVPAPSTAALLGLGGLVAARRRRA
ncbi:MAG: PEP-CTERM sorting domain-containing protein [Phycisphaerales bacterium JB040]